MLYLGEKEILAIERNWQELTDVIERATILIRDSDYAQPVKPYLRYHNPQNRIIAMPAFIGGASSVAGIKWIASFPSNIEKGLKRAHSVTILNEADTGRPFSIINTAMISAVRTAAVSGYFIREITAKRCPRDKFNVGIIGFGVIGQMHLEMIRCLLGQRLGTVYLFDIRTSPLLENAARFPEINIVTADSWQQAYAAADIFITCTVSSERYIDVPPRKGSLQLNVSLRDYLPGLRRYMDFIFVDNWEEVCRENTDIERMHTDQGLRKEDTLSVTTLPASQHPRWIDESAVIMFNPMGMAAYDIAVASAYYSKAMQHNIGTRLQ